MVTIKMSPVEDGCYFEIADFVEYSEALRARGIEPPKAYYRVFVSSENERKLRVSVAEWQRQLELFYQLGSDTKIPCQIVESI